MASGVRRLLMNQKQATSRVPKLSSPTRATPKRSTQTIARKGRMALASIGKPKAGAIMGKRK